MANLVRFLINELVRTAQKYVSVGLSTDPLTDTSSVSLYESAADAASLRMVIRPPELTTVVPWYHVTFGSGFASSNMDMMIFPPSCFIDGFSRNLGALPSLNNGYAY